MGRFEIIKGTLPGQNKQDAYERALELCNIPIDQVPELARAYNNYLINDRRLAVEPRLFLMSYAHYAQAVEGLPVADSKLKIPSESQAWFDMYNLETRKKHYKEISDRLREKLSEIPDMRQRIIMFLMSAITDYKSADETTRHLVLDSYCEIFCLTLQEAEQIGAAQERQKGPSGKKG
jgi:hypothetical protein